MEHSLTKATAFKKRTFWLLTPGIVAPALLNSTSFPGFGNLVSLTVGGPESEFRTAPLLAKFLHNRNSANASVKNYGSLSIFEDNDNKYLIENPSPFDDSIFGAEFSFKKGNIEEEAGSSGNPPPNPATQQKEDALVDKKLKFTKKTLTDSSDKDSLSSYSFSKESFNSSLKGKSDLNLIVDLEIDLSGNKKMFSTSVMPLNQFVFDNQSTIPLLKVKDQDSNPISDYVLEVKKEQSASLEMNIKKVTPTNPVGSRSRRSASPEKTSPITTLKVRNFFVIFSDNPPVSFENMFEDIKEQAGVVFQGSGTSFRKFFLENWKKKGSDSKGTEAEFEFNLNDAAWKSMCADPYKVGGFVESSAPSSKPSTTSSSSGKKTGTSSGAGQYVTAQKSQFEQFDPRSHARKLDASLSVSEAKKHTKAMPCSGVEATLKEGLKTNQELMPQPLKNAVNDSSDNQSQTKHSKIIPGSFRAWHDGDQYNSFYEQALTTSHYFEAKITKDKFKSQLLTHSKLKPASQDGGQTAPYTIPEVSTQLQVAIPYTFSIYDHDSKFLKVQRVNLNIDLDLKALYSQSQFTKDFFTYDLSKHHSKITEEYGLSGTITFSAGLFLDVEKNLNVRLITTTKGFVSTKKGSEGKEDLRETANKDSATKHTTPFIVVDVDQDPRISSFYVDRRVGNTSAPSSSAAPVARKDLGSGDQKPTTLKELDEKLETMSIKQLRKFDHTNNAEVFFYEIGAEEKMKNKELQTLGKVRVNFETPRRNSGSISIDTENLDQITLYLAGSSTLGNKYFNSIFSLAKATICASTQSSDKQTSSTNDCSSDKKYDEKQEKDVSVGDIDGKIGLRKVSVKWSDLQTAKEEKNAKEFEFLQVVSYYNPDKQDTKQQENWDALKSKFDNVFKTSSSSTRETELPDVSFAAVWYSVKLWYDEANKNLQYHTILRPITAINYGSKGWSLFSSSEYMDNTNFHKVAGSAARAGFQLGQIELEYKKGS